MAYSAQDKQRAKEAFERYGATHAARIIGIGRSTIKRWAADEGWKRQTGPIQGNGHHSLNGPVAGVAPAVAPDAAALKSDGGPFGLSGPLSGYQGLEYLSEAAKMRHAAAAAREAGRAREAVAFATASGIFSDKARLLGATDRVGNQQEALTPEQEQARDAHIVQLLSVWLRRAAQRDPMMVLELAQELAQAATDALSGASPDGDGWELHTEHPDADYAARVRRQRRLYELLEANGWNYPAALRRLKAEGLT